MSAINDVKNKIKDKLATITDLKTVMVSDIRKDPLDQEIQSYPACFIMPPAIGTVQRSDNRSVLRELTFTVMTVLKADDLPSANATGFVEDLMQQMLDVLDNSITLDNLAVGGLVPTSSFPEPFVHSSNSYIVFDIIVKARVVQTLLFN